MLIKLKGCVEGGVIGKVSQPFQMYIVLEERTLGHTCSVEDHLRYPDDDWAQGL